MTTGMVIGRPTYMGGAVSRGGLLCFSGLSWGVVGGLSWLLWITMVHGHGGDGFVPVWASNVCRGLRAGIPVPEARFDCFSSSGTGDSAPADGTSVCKGFRAGSHHAVCGGIVGITTFSRVSVWPSASGLRGRLSR